MRLLVEPEVVVTELTTRGGNNAPDATAAPELGTLPSTIAERATCAWCGRRITRHEEQYAVLWDSSAIHLTEAGMDGRRLVAACGAEQVATLRAAARPWIEEEFWAGRFARAERGGPGRPESPHVLARRAGITTGQMQRALAWRRGDPGRDRRG